jgi:hypothetical protein
MTDFRVENCTMSYPRAFAQKELSSSIMKVMYQHYALILSTYKPNSELTIHLFIINLLYKNTYSIYKTNKLHFEMFYCLVTN